MSGALVRLLRVGCALAVGTLVPADAIAQSTEAVGFVEIHGAPSVDRYDIASFIRFDVHRRDVVVSQEGTGRCTVHITVRSGGASPWEVAIDIPDLVPGASYRFPTQGHNTPLVVILAGRFPTRPSIAVGVLEIDAHPAPPSSGITGSFHMRTLPGPFTDGVQGRFGLPWSLCRARSSVASTTG